jgi:hypothetical protein
MPEYVSPGAPGFPGETFGLQIRNREDPSAKNLVKKTLF